MDKRLSSIIPIAAAAVLFVAHGAAAQTPAWAFGTWKGAVGNLRNDPKGPERVLVITADGKCRWDYAAKSDAPAPAKSCSVTADAVTILTGGDATVQLQNRGNRLEGTFQSKGGNSFHASFTSQWAGPAASDIARCPKTGGVSATVPCM